MAITKIAQATVGAGGATSIDFTGIPGTYTDLMIVCSLRDSSTSGDEYLLMNGAPQGAIRRLIGSGSGATSDTTNIHFRGSTSTQTANTFGSAQIYIANYANTGAKSVSIDYVNENNATAAEQGLVALTSSTTSAITSVGVGFNGTLQQYSSATLYGISKSGATGATVS